jgi:hypothetical protein
MKAKRCSKRHAVTVAGMRLVLMATLAAATAGIDTAHGRVESIAFKPVTVGEKRALHVEVEFRPAGTVTPIVVPTKWGGAAHLEGRTQNLKVLTPGASLENSTDPGENKLHAWACERVELAYDMVPYGIGPRGCVIWRGRESESRRVAGRVHRASWR